MSDTTTANRKNSYIWNTVSGMINAGQSVIILIFISHFYGKVEAGIFTIAYAIGNLGFSMGRYGVRNFQVTDVNNKYKYSDYWMSRLITVSVTLVSLLTYVAIKYFTGAYNAQKFIVVALICVWRLVDTLEDVFYGMYQQHGRLDLGAKCYSLRQIFSTLLFCVLFMLKLDFVLTTAIVLVATIISAYFFVANSYKSFNFPLWDFTKGNVKRILWECLPLCIGTTLAIYVGNAPKYVIDVYMDDVSQAYFGYIMMPAFAMVSLSNFIYQPLIKDYGDVYASGNTKLFFNKILKICGVILLLTLIVLPCGYLLGIPVLNLVYGVHLNMYKKEFMLLLLGGGFYAVATFLIIPLATMRRQIFVAVGYGIVAAISFVIGPLAVEKMQMMGASWMYVAINVILMVVLGIFVFIGNKKRSSGKEIKA